MVVEEVVVMVVEEVVVEVMVVVVVAWRLITCSSDVTPHSSRDAQSDAQRSGPAFHVPCSQRRSPYAPVAGAYSSHQSCPTYTNRRSGAHVPADSGGSSSGARFSTASASTSHMRNVPVAGA